MAVAHKDLTGTDLHEMKGASTATSGQVPIADGAGATPFGKLTASSLTGTGNPFGAQLLHVREQQNNNVAGGTFSSATWNVVGLNTVMTNEISSASLGSSTISLPAGTYYCEVRIPPFEVYTDATHQASAKVRLRNTTAGSTTIVGQGWNVDQTTLASGFYNTVSLHLGGRFTLGGTTSLQLQVYVTSLIAATQRPSNSGEIEVYTEAYIWKVA